METKLKFQLDYLPSNAHYNNLRYLLKKDIWNYIKNEIRKDKQYTCEFCGRKFLKEKIKFLECHEFWVFDISNRKQILKKLILLCHYCHQTQHINFSHLLNIEDKIISHFKKVNNLSTSDFNELKRKNLLFRNSAINLIEFSKDDLEKVDNWTLQIECDLTKYLPEKLKNEKFIYFLNNLNWRNE